MDALFITTSQVLHRFMSTESVMPSISSSVAPFSYFYQSFPASGSFPRTWDFSSGGKKYWSFSFSVSPSNEYLESLPKSSKKRGGGGRSEIKKEKILFFLVGAMRFSYLRRKMSRGET